MPIAPAAMPLIQSFLMSFAAALALVPMARRLSIRLDVVARPRADRWHRSVVPMLGGVAIGVAMLLTGLMHGLAESAPVILFAAMAMFLIGLLDDIMQLRPSTKLVGQIAAAAALIYFGLRLNWLESRLLDSVVTMVWVVGLTNAFNLLDNMDGLCAGTAFIVAVMLLAGFWTGVSYENAMPEMMLLAALAGGAAGFLVYNFPPASIFMGDSGSLLLGFTLAALTLGREGVRASRSDLLSVIAGPAFVLMIPIFDTTLVTVARLLSGRSPARGGRDHSSHRLVAIGLSERNAVLVLWILALFGGGVGLLLRNLSPDWSLPVGAIFLVGMCAFAVYLARVRVYDEVPGAPVGEGVTLVESTFMNRRRVFEVLVDASLIGATYYAATQLVFSDPEAYLRNAEVFYQSLPVIVVTQLVSFFARGLYRGVWQPFARGDVNKVLEAVLAGAAIAQVFLIAYYGSFAVSWQVVVLQALMIASAVILSRLIGRMFPP
jgi:UDP-GlcNAc:undecaprenyl-phosphate/decaprenyl-phosphate GlcNAc-1-phosphate transferase